MTGGGVSLQPIGIARSNSTGSANGGASLSSLVGNSKDYRIHRSMPLSEPLRGLPPMARPVDASYYPKAAPAQKVKAAPTSTSSTTSTTSTTSSSSSSGMYYRQRSDSFDDMFNHGRRSVSGSGAGGRRSFMMEPVTPFDEHLQDIYSGKYDISEGLAFFESHGYYDVDDANTVEMFRQNFGLKDLFWERNGDGVDEAALLYEAYNPDTNSYHSVGTTLYRRHRTYSGRFQLVDDDGNEIDEESQLELEREERIKAKVLELDDYDLRELEQEEAVMVKAISVIRLEKSQFQQYFYEAFREEDVQFNYVPSPPVQQVRRTTIPTAITPVNVQLPPYCGNVFMLKDTIPYLLRSWHKRWFYLDFNSGLVMMYKRSYWKSPRGVLDLRTVTKVERMNQGDFRLEFRDKPMMLLRTKMAEEAELWVNLLKFAKHHVGTSPTPQLTQEVSPEMRANLMASKKNNKKKGKANQVEMLAMLLSNSSTAANTNATTA